MHTLIADLRYTFRTIRKSPLFAAVAILTLALGVGANTAIFTLVNAVLLRPLPFPEPGRLVFIWEETSMFGLKDSVVALGNYTEWRARSRSFEKMGALEQRLCALSGSGETLQVNCSLVTASLFDTLGVRPAMGRLFRDDEDKPGAPKVAILGDGLWRRTTGGDPNIVGKSVTFNDEKYEVVGVMPPGFQFPYRDNDLWAPIGTFYGPAEFVNRGRHNFMVAARLAPGVAVARANQEIRSIAGQLEREYPETNHAVSAFVAPMRDHFVSETRSTLWILLAAVGFVLLIGCANIANLLLARAAGRRREIAIRTAVGAGRGALVRQLLTESLVLSLAGGFTGLLAALWGIRFLEKLVPSGIAAISTLRVDAGVLLFTLAVSLLTGLIFGLAPVFQALRFDLHQILKQGGGARNATAGRTMERALVVVEVALAFVLAIGAGLLMQTFARVRGVDPGFPTKNLLAVRISGAPQRYATVEKLNALYDKILLKVKPLPGVASAGFTNGVPIAFKGWVNGFAVEGREGQANSNFRVVTADFLQTLGVRLVEGRLIGPFDAGDRPVAIVVNQAFQRKFWPNESAIGKRIRFRSELPWMSIVGVIADVRQAGLDVPSKAEMYLSAKQIPAPANYLLLRTAHDPALLAGPVRRAIHEAAPDIAVADIQTMDEILDREVSQRKMQMTLLALFAGVALLLASLGIYGVLAYLVSRRTQEIGIRMALGAGPAEVLRSVLGEGLALSGAGIAIGIAGALALTRVLSKLLFGVTPTDPATFAAVALLLVAVAVTASWLPARRAMRVDPVLALREE
jgi:putative ABC transport system permease protein